MIWDMIIKLNMQMYRQYVIMPVDNSDDAVIDDVTMSSRNISKFWTTVTSLIFELERQSKLKM